MACQRSVPNQDSDSPFGTSSRGDTMNSARRLHSNSEFLMFLTFFHFLVLFVELEPFVSKIPGFPELYQMASLHLSGSHILFACITHIRSIN
jgi:hypothetical protein